MIKTVFVGLILLFSVVFANVRDVAAVDITLVWDANIETNLAGYRLFCREASEEYNYEYPDWDGVETEGTIYNLANGIIYYFVARAYTTEDYESGDSNEVCYDGTARKIPTPVEPEEEEEEKSNNNRGCFINILRR